MGVFHNAAKDMGVLLLITMHITYNAHKIMAVLEKWVSWFTSKHEVCTRIAAYRAWLINVKIFINQERISSLNSINYFHLSKTVLLTIFIENQKLIKPSWQPQIMVFNKVVYFIEVFCRLLCWIFNKVDLHKKFLIKLKVGPILHHVSYTDSGFWVSLAP